MKKFAMLTKQVVSPFQGVLSQVAQKLEAAGSTKAATLLDRAANELDVCFEAGKEECQLSQERKVAICSALDTVAGGLEKAGAKDSAELLDKVQNSLDSLFEEQSDTEVTAQQDGCKGCDEPEEVALDLEEEETEAKKQAVVQGSDVVSVKVTSQVRLMGDPDKNGFRTPSFVKEATKAKWSEAVQGLVDSGRGYHQDGSPNYGRAIDLYRASSR